MHARAPNLDLRAESGRQKTKLVSLPWEATGWVTLGPGNPTRVHTCLERKHVLLQEKVGPRADRELDTILGTPRYAWNLTNTFGKGVV